MLQLPNRAYTVKEIDDLRLVVSRRELYGNSVAMDSEEHGIETERGFQNWIYVHATGRGSIEAASENKLRTYMLAGVTAEDIIKEDLLKLPRLIEIWKRTVPKAKP